jgi:hypothetical protein
MVAAASSKSSRVKVREHRARLREQGLRPIQIWVPDVRSPAFRAAAHRQSLAVAGSGHARATIRHSSTPYRTGPTIEAGRVKRGDIRSVSGGRDYAGKPRPVVIVQDDSFDATDSITVCAFTTDPTDAPDRRWGGRMGVAAGQIRYHMAGAGSDSSWAAKFGPAEATDLSLTFSPKDYTIKL